MRFMYLEPLFIIFKVVSLYTLIFNIIVLLNDQLTKFINI